MAIDRLAVLRYAETLIGDGQVDRAIDEYVRLLVHEPNDRHVAMLLGDVYLRAGRIEEGVGQLAALARRFRRDGFLAKATALYKKILKITPDDDRTWLELADVAASQGKLVDARGYLTIVGDRRRSAGDHAGVAEVARLVAELPSRWEAASAPDVLRRPGGPLNPQSQHEVGRDVSPAKNAGPEGPASIPSRDAEHIVGRDFSPADHGALDDVFAGFRDQASERLSIDRMEEEFRRGMALHAAGQIDACITALQAASRAPRRRAEAAAVLGRIYRERGERAQAIEWFERAADGAVPTPEAGRRLLYELADALEWAGETARALALFLDLRADAADDDDLESRIARLTTVQERG